MCVSRKFQFPLENSVLEQLFAQKSLETVGRKFVHLCCRVPEKLSIKNGLLQGVFCARDLISRKAVASYK